MKKENYTIRLCRIDEHDKLINFLRNHWKEDHVFVQSKEVLDFQHLDEEKQVYNFIVAHNEITKEFDAVLGFIPTSQYDKNLSSNRDFWGAIWKSNVKGLGCMLLEEILVKFNVNTFSFINITKAAQYALNGKIFCNNKRMTLLKMKHYYIRNIYKKEYRLAKFCKNDNTLYGLNNDLFVEIDEIFFKRNNFSSNRFLSKSNNYFINRFFKHPFYKYHAFYLKTKTQFVVIFTQIRQVNGEKCIRIVDWIGKFPDNIYSAFLELLKEFDCEYIDLMCYVENDQAILNMGFCAKKQDEEIIPHYFEPFEKENIDITIAYYAKDLESPSLYIGDADSNRLNSLEYCEKKGEKV